MTRIDRIVDKLVEQDFVDIEFGNEPRSTPEDVSTLIDMVHRSFEHTRLHPTTQWAKYKESVESILKSASTWASVSELQDIAQLLADEWDYVTCVGSVRGVTQPITDIEDFAEGVGLSEPENLADFDISPDLPAAERIAKYLVAYPKHGEVLGAIIGAFAGFSGRDKEIVKPALLRAIRSGVENGVDH